MEEAYAYTYNSRQEGKRRMLGRLLLQPHGHDTCQQSIQMS